MYTYENVYNCTGEKSAIPFMLLRKKDCHILMGRQPLYTIPDVAILHSS